MTTDASARSAAPEEGGEPRDTRPAAGILQLAWPAILSNLLFQVEGSRITVTATDMEVELVCEIEHEAGSDGAIALPARKLLDICRALPAEAQLTIEAGTGKAKIASGRSRF